MANKILIVFILLNALFVACGGMLLAEVVVSRVNQQSTQTVSNVAQNLLMGSCPLMAAGLNAIFIFATFILSIPAMASTTRRTILRFHGYAVVFCAFFSTAIGLVIWFETLKTRSNMGKLWAQQTPHVQSLLQQRFQCCGYMSASSPPFVQDNTCTNSLVAASLQGCVTPLSTFANNYLNLVFTAAFGIAALDVLLLLSIACLFKDRKERERFKLIDAKSDVPI